MLRFDRFLVTPAQAIDLATGRPVDFVRPRPDAAPSVLFESRHGRTLIDVDVDGKRRCEVWEHWLPHGRPRDLQAQLNAFIEMLECARAGVPRAFDLVNVTTPLSQYLRRALAREARLRGWVPIAVDLLARHSEGAKAKWPPWLGERSLVVFAETPGMSGDAVIALLRLAHRDVRPHVLVRTLLHRADAGSPFQPNPSGPLLLHETVAAFGSATPPVTALNPSSSPAAGKPSLAAEAASRWALLLEESMGGRERERRALDLAQLLAARDQPFEARALVESVPATHPERSARGAAVLSRIEHAASTRASKVAPVAPGSGRKGWDMVDDFVGVLQMCQDIEDEQTALARVGAYLRERLHAASVAFVAREGRLGRVLARAGCETSATDLALQSIATGVAIHPSRSLGPVECACPVRHATEVIGALWCRWSAGTPVATEQASTLLGVAAAAVAPSVRLALAKARPSERGNPIPELVGGSAAMAAVRDAILRAAASPFPVVIEGESGSGKELAARAIHARSVRRDRRFCAINCAALVDDLVEAELFGHTRGAFTGATTDRAGVFEEASGSTLFLDEVAELSTRVQAKLLRTLQEHEVRRLGESMVRKVDVRLVAATNRPLAQAVEAGAFRADLWYRLDVIRIALPPLRQRLEDLPALVAHLWHGLATRTGSRAALAPATIGMLAQYDWPGNIRELQNVLASLAVSVSHTGLIGPASLPLHIARVAALERATTLADARRQFEERYVRAALARAGGRTGIAARELGLSRQGLSKLMSRLGIAELRASNTHAANVQ